MDITYNNLSKSEALSKLNEEYSYIQDKYVDIHINRLISKENKKNDIKNITIAKAIKIIQSCHNSDKSAITFLNMANPVTNRTKFNIKVNNIFSNDIKYFLKDIYSKETLLHIAGKNSVLIDLKKKINHEEKFDILIRDWQNKDKKEYLHLSSTEAIDKLKHLGSLHQCTLCMNLFNTRKELGETTNELILFKKEVSNLQFSIEYINVDNKELFNVISAKKFDILFKSLSKEKASSIITSLRNLNIDFTLGLENLNINELKEMIELADRKSQPVSMTKVKHFDDLFIGDNEAIIVLHDFMLRGLEYLVYISEENPIDWRSIVMFQLLLLPKQA